MTNITFKQKVLDVVSKIPKGKVLTYKDVAKKAGSSNASRAVGSILKQNFNPKIPCHRVIKNIKISKIFFVFFTCSEMKVGTFISLTSFEKVSVFFIRSEMKVGTFISLTSFEKVGVFCTCSEMKVGTFISLTSFENKK